MQSKRYTDPLSGFQYKVKESARGIYSVRGWFYGRNDFFLYKQRSNIEKQMRDCDFIAGNFGDYLHRSGTNPEEFAGKEVVIEATLLDQEFVSSLPDVGSVVGHNPCGHKYTLSARSIELALPN